MAKNPNKFQTVKPYPVRLKHNHKVTDRVVRVSDKRVTLESGASYPAHMVERV